MLIANTAISLNFTIFFQVIFLALLKIFTPAAAFILGIVIIKREEAVVKNTDIIHFWFNIDFILLSLLMLWQTIDIIELIYRKCGRPQVTQNDVEASIPAEVIIKNSNNIRILYFSRREDESILTCYFRITNYIVALIELILFIFQNVIVGLNPAGFDKIYDSGRITAVLFIIIYCERILEIILIVTSNIMVKIYEKLVGKQVFVIPAVNLY